MQSSSSSLPAATGCRVACRREQSRVAGPGGRSGMGRQGRRGSRPFGASRTSNAMSTGGVASSAGRGWRSEAKRERSCLSNTAGLAVEHSCPRRELRNRGRHDRIAVGVVDAVPAHPAHLRAVLVGEHPVASTFFSCIQPSRWNGPADQRRSHQAILRKHDESGAPASRCQLAPGATINGILPSGLSRRTGRRAPW